jgi:hypothetical protein
MAVLHKIKAWLYKNYLLGSESEYLIRVSSERTLDVHEICVTAVSRGGADISVAAMEHAVILFLNEMGYQLCDGFSINVGWFTAGAQVKGGADSPNEQYYKEKHTVVFEFHQGSLLRQELENVTVEILGVANVNAYVDKVFDVKSGTTNDLLTPSRPLKIAGYKIKIAGEKDANGIYFVNQSTGERTKVYQSDFVTNNPSEVIVVIPDLSAGMYSLEVTTQYAASSLLKEPRTTIFDKILTVE